MEPNQDVALTVPETRQDIIMEILELVRSHLAFQSDLVWRTLVKTGVRPALQHHLISTTDMNKTTAMGCAYRAGHDPWVSDKSVLASFDKTTQSTRRGCCKR